MFRTMLAAFLSLALVAACSKKDGDKKTGADQADKKTEVGKKTDEGETKGPQGVRKDHAARVAAYKAFVDETCACVDKKENAKECTKAAKEKYSKHDPRPDADQLSAEDVTRWSEDIEAPQEKMSECLKKMAEAGNE